MKEDSTKLIITEEQLQLMAFRNYDFYVHTASDHDEDYIFSFPHIKYQGQVILDPWTPPEVLEQIVFPDPDNQDAEFDPFEFYGEQTMMDYIGDLLDYIEAPDIEQFIKDLERMYGQG